MGIVKTSTCIATSLRKESKNQLIPSKVVAIFNVLWYHIMSCYLAKHSIHGEYAGNALPWERLCILSETIPAVAADVV